MTTPEPGYLHYELMRMDRILNGEAAREKTAVSHRHQILEPAQVPATDEECRQGKSTPVHRPASG